MTAGIPACRAARVAFALLCLTAITANIHGVQAGSRAKKVSKVKATVKNRAPGIVANKEPLVWADTLASVMSSVQGVSWFVDWQDLGLAGVAPNSKLHDDPDLNGQDSQMMQMVNCINDQFTPNSGKYMSWEMAMANKLDYSGFKIVAAWWNNHQPTGPITATTSGTVTRLTQVYAQCKSLPNIPLSVALYIPLVTENGKELTKTNQAILLTAVLQVAQFISDMKTTRNTCLPDVMLFWEPFQDEASSKLMYPLNIPRNFARLQARTPLIAEIDIDLVVSRALSTRFTDPVLTEHMTREAYHKTVFIMPAFDINRNLERAAWAEALVSFDKEMMVYSYQRNISHQFDYKGYPQGHNISNYDHWMVATEDYPTKHGHMAEPWFLGARTLLPWHDARYRGYGKDKVQFVEDTHYKGFEFKVLHDAFVIHRAHKKGEVANLYLKQAQAHRKGTAATTEDMYSHYNGMYQEQCALQEAGQAFYAPVTPATLNCMKTLPWWQGAPSLRYLNNNRQRRHAA